MTLLTHDGYFKNLENASGICPTMNGCRTSIRPVGVNTPSPEEREYQVGRVSRPDNRDAVRRRAVSSSLRPVRLNLPERKMETSPGASPAAIPRVGGANYAYEDAQRTRRFGN